MIEGEVTLPLILFFFHLCCMKITGRFMSFVHESGEFYFFVSHRHSIAFLFVGIGLVYPP